MPLIPVSTSYPQTRQEPGKHSHPELLALGIAEDLSHCSTDCLQIFIYIPSIYIYICTWDMHPHQPQAGKISKERSIPGDMCEKWHPRRTSVCWTSEAKLFEETESSSAICNVMSLICILQKNISLNRCKGRWRRGSICSLGQVSSSHPLVPSPDKKSAYTVTLIGGNSNKIIIH